MNIHTLNLKVAAIGAGALILLTTVLVAAVDTESCDAETWECGPSPLGVILGILQALAWLSLALIAGLALWRRFGPAPTDDTDGVDGGGDPFAGYGAAGEAAYQMLTGDQPAPTPAPGTSYQEHPDGYLVLGAPIDQPAPAPADPDAVDFDALFSRGKEG
ncbi:hypothetical protein [Mycobacteroides abscessus]|uniref:hypothetical protein n=1 Tax=Mycobacteroides abscessus TaxID=36809 RepID=UPI0019D2698C|nr:hypothetical protein [Mycobacteroides abscessus]MBN7457552.1 hypothetical protein [Mycobacteroides abscessus subsp. abscessus]